MTSTPVRPSALGLTLIEVLITLALVALLWGLAWPAYQAQMQRARRTEARQALVSGALWLGRMATVQGRYPAAPDWPVHLQLSATGLYRLRYAPSEDRSAYTLSATPEPGPQQSDPCGTWVLDQAGERRLADGASPALIRACWGR
ncbi:type IV pilin protein [Curvibacter sp. HBC61]|uniref:Type IV pilin protein n=1 Tax=Curvibacter cyanobacteriorum TaxID=3026422 RepID=A0ABT5MSN0_9BURK|nr:type IV pilin protein [Curvibacter sp. HBC61]MDD0837049.1 type IV pilin protein [Curvibacter sp. HBC61]